MSDNRVRLGDLIELRYGKALPGRSRKPGPYAVYGSNGIVGRHSSFLLGNQTIVVGRKGSIGEITLTEDQSWPIDTTYYVVIEDESRLDLRYLFFYMKTLRLKRLDTSSAVPGLNRKFVLELSIPLPPIGTQREITRILERVEALIRKRRDANQLMSKIVQSVFLKMFGDPMSNPKGWKVPQFGELIDELRYGTSVKCSSTANGGIPVLRIPNVLRGSIDLGELKFANLSFADLERYGLRDGDMLFVRTNGNREYVGRCAVFHQASRSYAFASYLIRVRLRTTRMNPDFARVLLSFPALRDQLFLRARTSAGQYNINAEGIRSVKMMLPPLELQNEFASILARDARLTEAQKQSEEEISKLFDSLMHKAFSGDLKSAS